MVEPAYRFPSLGSVAAGALRPQLPLMTILVAGNAIPAKSQERAAEVFRFDLAPRSRADSFLVVACAALELPVLTSQGKSRLRSVIEPHTANLDKHEFPPVMFHVARSTLRLA